MSSIAMHDGHGSAIVSMLERLQSHPLRCIISRMQGFSWSGGRYCGLCRVLRCNPRQAPADTGHACADIPVRASLAHMPTHSPHHTRGQDPLLVASVASGAVAWLAFMTTRRIPHVLFRLTSPKAPQYLAVSLSSINDVISLTDCATEAEGLCCTRGQAQDTHAGLPRRLLW